MSQNYYTEYKKCDSGWLEKIPSHWRNFPCRAIVVERSEKNLRAANQDYLSLMANVGVIPYEEKGDVGNKKPEDLSKCKLVYAGDLVVNSMNYGIGSYGLSKYTGVCSPVYIVMTPIDEVVEGRFAFRIFENKAFQAYAQSFGNGILEHRAAINWDILKSIKIGLPPIEEQRLILDFLDFETGKIDLLIAEQESLVSLLLEQRQADITNAVSKGLNPHVQFIDTPLKWFGKIPSHWRFLKLRRVLSHLEQGWSPNAMAHPCEEGQTGVLKLSAIKRGKFVEAENKALIDGTVADKKLLLKAGDFLLTRANTPELVGDCCVVPNEFSGSLMLSDLVYRLKFNQEMDQNFATYFFQSSHGRTQIKIDARGSSMSMAKVSQGHILDWMVSLPPIEEQREIVDFLDKKLNANQTLISECVRTVDLLVEQRSALISACVSGKIDVRGFVKK